MSVEETPEPTERRQAEPQEAKTTAEELGRKAAEWLKATRPKVDRFVEENRPRVERAGRDAVAYVRAHEGEIKDSATKLARSRLRGPLGAVVDGLSGTRPENASNALECGSCSHRNPSGSRFCNQCGAALGQAESLDQKV